MIDDLTKLVILRGTRAYGPRHVVVEHRVLVVCDTLDEARKAIARRVPLLTRLPRSPGDDLVIVESWV